jgi:hypothetical protein
MKVTVANHVHRSNVCWFEVMLDGYRAPVICFEVGINEDRLAAGKLTYAHYSFRFDAIEAGHIFSEDEMSKFVVACQRSEITAALVFAALNRATESNILSISRLEEFLKKIPE